MNTVRPPGSPGRATAARSRSSPPIDARPRAVVDAVLPMVDCGRFAVKRVVGEPLRVEAHCFADGHDKLRAKLLWRRDSDRSFHEVEMQERSNDEWFASFTPVETGGHLYTVTAWVDHFLSWREDFARRVDRDDIVLAAQVGAALIGDAARRARGADRAALRAWASTLQKAAARSGEDVAALQAVALDIGAADIAARYPDQSQASLYAPELPLWVDRARAGFSSWYELFPRSAGPAGRHGNFDDVIARLPYIADLGFDVLYLPPIHPIGRINRKGRNNALVAEAGDVGSPWAIGSVEGGHKDIHPALGTPEDFRRLVAAAAERGIEVALDIAFQCAPDHPYVAAHPQWFRQRPDGSIQYAENPPKKYQDIYPFDFESEDWLALWKELRSVLEHWIGQGVRIFRVDNPHTKSFAFWAWAIEEIRRGHPDVLFLAEAFTRPKVMHRLAKVGFSQSYTYFTWRHSAAELREYFEELADGPGRDYFRPNVWPNTPDILDKHLHGQGRAAFAIRLLLAATLSANYGIYGPAFELMESTPRSVGSEEYLDSEKYQLRSWATDADDGLQPLIRLLNRIRAAQPALQNQTGVHFVEADNDRLLACVRRAPEGDALLVVANLDPVNRQSGWIELDAAALPFDIAAPYFLHDLLSGRCFVWQGPRNFVILDPRQAPGHVFRVTADVAAAAADEAAA